MQYSSLVLPYVCLVFLLAFITKVRAQQTVFDVTKFGGVGDGKTDNSKPFMDAWTQACQNNGGGAVLFPAGTFFVNPVVLKGGCKGPIAVQIQGTLLAPQQVQSSVDDHWISFEHVDNLAVNGGGLLDGRGPSAWPFNDCPKNPTCKRFPASLRFDYVTNANIDHITSIDSKMVHINLYQCHDINIHNINISAPGDSLNTDGIHMGLSYNIHILDSVIATGDDCISFSTGTHNVNISGVHCGPGHGISIGSLGKEDGEDVSFVDVRDCSFVGTQNGVRIKTWAPSKPGNVAHINFEHIQMDNVQNPVFIDQQYCPGGTCSTTESSSVHIEDVKFNDIRGTSSTRAVVNLQCSRTVPCQKIEMRDIDLSYNGGPAVSACANAQFTTFGKQNPPACTAKTQL